NGVGATSATRVSTNSPATCTGTTSPAITVVKGKAGTPNQCVIAFNQPTQNFNVTFTATLTNTGNENVNSITCSDVPLASLNGVPASLAAGASAVITGSSGQPTATPQAPITVKCTPPVSSTAPTTNPPPPLTRP